MYLLSVRSLLTTVVSVCLIVCQAHGRTPVLSQRPDRRGAETAEEQQQSEGERQQQQLGDEGEGGRRDPCEEGWIYTHHHCLLNTGLESQHKAEVYCSQHGAQQVRGICIKQAPVSDLSSLTSENQEGSSLAPSATAQSDFVCPAGWTQYEEFCFFRPGTIPKICGLLGASYVFNYCVTRVPHKVPVDFIQAVKRLEGSDYDLQRDTRICCCMGGGGLC